VKGWLNRLGRGWPGASFRRVLLIQVGAMLVGWAVWILAYWLGYMHGTPPGASLRNDLPQVAQLLADTAALKPERAALDARLQGLHNGYTEMLRMKTPAFGWVVWRADGSVLASDRAEAAWWAGRTAASEGDIEVPGRGTWYAVQRLSADGSMRAAAAVQREALNAQLGLLLRATLVPTLWIVPFLLPTTLLIAWVATLPVRRLAREIEGRDAADLRPVDDTRVPAELRPVAGAINGWLRSLAQARGAEAAARERERTFFANAAHELRTPLAAIGAHAHTLAQRAAGQGEPAQAATTAGLQAAVRRMAALLDQLLLLARLDAQAHTEAVLPLDLAQVLRERVAHAAPRALALGTQLSLQAQAPAPLHAQPEALHSVIDNLIDNALKYTPPGGEVQVLLQRRAPGWAVGVLDNGPGVPPALHEQVFERFFRAPGAQQPGTGLGLAIVRETTRAAGGTVALGPGLGGRGLGIWVTWPAGAAAG
jgi:signal transduction histidine kinase